MKALHGKLLMNRLCMKKKINFILLSAFFLSVVACNQKSAAPQVVVSPFKPSATIQEIMLAVIDPNVDPIWNSIKTTITAQGVEETKPTSDEDWAALKLHAIALSEASNLLMIEGRKVAHPSASTSTHSSELGPQEIEALIAANRPAFIKNAQDLHDTVTLALSAIEAKDVDTLESVGGAIDQACEQCHSQFWYPGDKRPTQ
ncbi:MAG: hypothetical protein EOO07_37625 [Chitinophagaceae bacterium]|nr:MAG: hypothetical protein EOO07_37625 [Chitinophagaceae bacterium]